ncbi:MAG: hypothetical protein RIC03_17715 [Cyclobacteriaceae bacterium]
MNKLAYFSSIKESHAALIKEMSAILLGLEPNLEEKVLKMMGSDMLCYYENDAFKYGFSSHDRHVSFHNMVMYCYPNVREEIGFNFKKSQLKKSCVNFDTDIAFAPSNFEALIIKSKEYPFPKPTDKI